jgi:hypothetical protein
MPRATTPDASTGRAHRRHPKYTPALGWGSVLGALAALLFIAAMQMHFALRLPVTWLAGRDWLAADATRGLVSLGWHSFYESSEKGRPDTAGRDSVGSDSTGISRAHRGHGRFGRGWSRSSSQVGGFTLMWLKVKVPRYREEEGVYKP